MDIPMNICNRQISLHPNFLEALFAHRSQVTTVFKDILGLYEISHFAISHIDSRQRLLTFSSTPSLEFNLFNSDLWRFDKTYHPSWYRLCLTSSWQPLYSSERYDELYYLKQIKPHYPIGLSMAVKTTDSYVIYSIASAKDCQQTQELFINQQSYFYRIGEYCSNALLPLILM